MTDVAALTRAEVDSLTDCEQRIERGLKTFVEVGQALASIRESRLYKGTHDTFEAYCRERWGFTDRRARQMIDAAEIGNMFPVENARQAAALASVPVAERADVLAEASERTGGKPTARTISEVAKERIASTPAQAAEPADVATSAPDLPLPEPQPEIQHAGAEPAAEPTAPVATWTDEEREEYERENERLQMIRHAHKASMNLVSDLRHLVNSIVTGVLLGEPELVTPDMVAEVRRLADTLESRMEVSA